MSAVHPCRESGMVLCLDCLVLYQRLASTGIFVFFGVKRVMGVSFARLGPQNTLGNVIQSSVPFSPQLDSGNVLPHILFPDSGCLQGWHLRNLQ